MTERHQDQPPTVSADADDVIALSHDIEMQTRLQPYPAGVTLVPEAEAAADEAINPVIRWASVAIAHDQTVQRG